MLLIQHEPDRYEAYRSMAPWHVDDELECICVFNSDLIAETFRSADFHVIDYQAAYVAITARTGIDMSAIVTALDHIPLAMEGTAHKRLRNEIASILGSGLREHREAISRSVRDIVATVFKPGRRVDLVEDVFVPIYKETFGLILGIDHTRIDTDPMISQIFDRKISLNRRKKMQAAIQSLAESLDRHSEENAIERNLAVALNILGHDAMIGSLSNSAWHIFKTGAGERLETKHDHLLPVTSVPYIERVASVDTVIGDLEVRKGQRVRLFLDAASGRAVEGDDPGLFFGRGRHLCLGKPVTMLIWQTFTNAIRDLDCTILTDELEIREKDYVFSYAEHAWIRIAP